MNYEPITSPAESGTSVHPPSIPVFWQISGSRLQPGFPAAHSRIRLPLLPSGPGGIGRAWVAQDLIFNITHLISHQKIKEPQVGIRPRYSGFRVTGHR